jgi:hypothetical protein
MKKYVMNKVNEADHVVFTFGEDGRLISLEFSGLEDPQRAAILTKCPLNEREMDWWKRNSWVEITIIEGPDEFDNFWDAYAYKVGHNKRAKRLWGLLSESERRAAITGIRRYNSYLAQHPTIEKAYPETYLSQKRWESYK